MLSLVCTKPSKHVFVTYKGSNNMKINAKLIYRSALVAKLNTCLVSQVTFPVMQYEKHMLSNYLNEINIASHVYYQNAI